MITITDPQERTVYVLDPRRRTVSKPTAAPGPPRRRGDGARGERPLPPPQIVSEPLGARQMWKVLTAKRWEVLKAMAGQGGLDRFGGHLRDTMSRPVTDTAKRRARGQFTDEFKGGVVRLCSTTAKR